MRRSSHLNLVNSSPSPQAVGEPVEQPRPEAVRIDPYAARPELSPDIRAAAFTLLSRVRHVQSAFCGSCATYAGLDHGIEALELIAHDLPGLLAAALALRAERAE